MKLLVLIIFLLIIIILFNLQTENDSLNIDDYTIKIYFYKLDDSGLVDDTSDESTCKMKRCILPNADFCGIWESLIFQEPIKEIVIISVNKIYQLVIKIFVLF